MMPVRFSTSRNSKPPASLVMDPPSNCPRTSRCFRGLNGNGSWLHSVVIRLSPFVGVTATLNIFYATKRQPLLFFNEKCGLERINKKLCPRVEHSGWNSSYLSFRFSVSSEIVGHHGIITALVDAVGEPSLLEARLEVQDVLTEPEIIPPEKMEFRPAISLGRPGRRNNLVLYVNLGNVPLGHWIRVRLLKTVGDVLLIDDKGTRCEQVDIKLGPSHHIQGQNAARILIPWNGTAWNQRAAVEATVKVGPDMIVAEARIRLDEPDPNEGGFFKKVDYTELDGEVPSQYAAGTISVNNKDPLNREVFGEDKQEFDKRLLRYPAAQQRLVSLLIEEAAFRALEELRQDNKLRLPPNREVAAVHEEVDKYKFTSTLNIFKALVK